MPHVAITRGANPILGWDRGRRFEIDIRKMDAVDTLGAGDVLHGAFCYHFARMGEFEPALRMASEIATEIVPDTRHSGMDGSFEVGMIGRTRVRKSGPGYPKGRIGSGVISGDGRRHRSDLHRNGRRRSCDHHHQSCGRRHRRSCGSLHQSYDRPHRRSCGHHHHQSCDRRQIRRSYERRRLRNSANCYVRRRRDGSRPNGWSCRPMRRRAPGYGRSWARESDSSEMARGNSGRRPRNWAWAAGKSPIRKLSAGRSYRRAGFGRMTANRTQSPAPDFANCHA